VNVEEDGAVLDVDAVVVVAAAVAVAVIVTLLEHVGKVWSLGWVEEAPFAVSGRVAAKEAELDRNDVRVASRD